MLNRRKRYRRKSLLGSILTRSRNEIKHNKDFDWRPGKKNPFTKKEGIDWGWRVKLGAILISLLGMLVIFIYHPFFHIQKFNITGLQRINQTEFRNSLEGMIDYRKFFILPAKSYLLVDPDEMADLIKSRFPIESITVTKVFPQTMNVIVKEKISTVIYDNGKQYSYLGLDGNIVEILRNVGEDEWKQTTKTVSTTLADGTIRIEEQIIDRWHTPPVNSIVLEMGDYPIVYDKRMKEGKINDVMLAPEIIQGTIEWFNLLHNQTDISIGYFVLDSELGEVNIKMREGWEIKADLLKRISEQFSDFQFVLKEKVNRSNLSYIDLRYQDKVYWK